ncbi:MAG TPA: copper chaperone PCu(A)C [Thermoanaerobaculia bacterium]
MRLIATVVIFLTACGPGSDAPTGRELYLAYGCAACHGEQADGNGPAAGLAAFKPKDLRDVAGFGGGKTAEAIAAVIAFGVADGRTGMPAYPDIPKRERLAIAEYILSLTPPAKEVALERAWAAESNPAWKIAAAYLELANRTDVPVAVVGVSSPAAKTVEMHETTVGADGVMSMRQVERIVVEAHERVLLQPGGSHLMLIDLNRDLRAGDRVELTLTFSDKTTRKVTAPVRAAASSPLDRRALSPATVSAATADLTLVDHHNQPFRFSSLRGKSAILFFGYTHCPDACPTLMSKIARAYREAGAEARDIPTLFVSVDPRDTPEVLDRYLDYFAAVPAKGLTGSKAQIDAVVKRFGARYEIRQSGSAAGPLVDHTLRIYLLDAGGTVKTSFDPSADAADIAKAMLSF